MTRQFAGFLMAGGLAAVANFGSRIAFSRVLPLAAAVVLAYLVGMVVAFVLMRSRVFPPSALPLHRQILFFTAVNSLALVQTLVITLALADWLLPAWGVAWHVDELAHAVGIGVPVVTSFLGHKHLSFRPGTEAKRKRPSPSPTPATGKEIP